MLMCNKKGIKNGYPLKIVATKVKIVEMEMNQELVRKLITKLDMEAFRGALADLELKVPEQDTQAYLQEMHHVLLQVHVIEGKLVCPESGRVFPISNGIPNMLLREDEV